MTGPIKPLTKPNPVQRGHHTLVKLYYRQKMAEKYGRKHEVATLQKEIDRQEARLDAIEGGEEG